MAATETLIIGAGSTGCRLVKEYRKRNPEKPCDFSFQEEEPFTAPEVILRDAPACTIIVAGLGGNAGSTFTPEITKHAKQHGRVFAVITLPFPFEKQRRERAMEALGRLKEHAEAVIITDLGKVLETVPMSANTGDVMRDVNEKILEIIYTLYEAHQADHGFLVDAIRDKLPQDFMYILSGAGVDAFVKPECVKEDIKVLQQEIADISEIFDTDSAVDVKKCREALGTFTVLCTQIGDAGEKQKTAGMIADVYCKLAEHCMEAPDIFSGLNCVVGCRSLHEMLPSDEHIACRLLQCMTGLFYVKNILREDGMVDDFMDEVFELADGFPASVCIQRQAGVCIQNLIAMCGSFDAPISLAYNAAERMDKVADRFPGDFDLQNVYAHILISACIFGKQTNNGERLSRFRTKLKQLIREREEAVDTDAVNEHFLEAVGIM